MSHIETDDIIDVSDLTDRLEELRDERQALVEAVEEAQEALDDTDDSIDDADQEALASSPAQTDLTAAQEALATFDGSEEAEELKELEGVLKELEGYGGDHQFDGDWYPGTLIARSYFVEYVEDMLKDIGDLPRDLPDYIAIDWQKTADNIEVDYATIDIDGNEYLYR